MLIRALLIAASLVAPTAFAQGVSTPPRATNQQTAQNQTTAQPTDPVPRAIGSKPNETPETYSYQTNGSTDTDWYANPDWWQVVLTVIFGIVATLAFLSDRNAVRLTQRADMLLDQVGLSPRPQPCYLTSETTFTIAFQNFGATRANEVTCEEMRFFIPGVKEKEVAGTRTPIPITTVAPGDQYVLTFPKLGLRYDDATIKTASKGDIPLLFEAGIRYEDVFGKKHVTRCRGTYYGATGVFVTEGEQEAS